MAIYKYALHKGTEEKMETMQNPLEPTKKETDTVIFWRKNQVAFTFRSHLNPAEGKQRVIDELPLDQLNNFLREQLQVTLRSFGPNDVPRPNGEGDGGDGYTDNGNQSDDLRNPRAKY